MRPAYTIFPLGDHAASFQFSGDEIDPRLHGTLVQMRQSIDQKQLHGVIDLVLGYHSITILIDPSKISSVPIEPSLFDVLSKILEQAYLESSAQNFESHAREIEIPVCYHDAFGLDIQSICERNQISREELIRLHTSRSYTIYLVGFLPGFPYMGFVDPQLEMPRHATPRKIVHAGSVGIAGKQTGIYPMDSPGGWQIIGRTPLHLFDAQKDPPVLVETGDHVKFHEISLEEYNHLNDHGK